MATTIGVKAPPNIAHAPAAPAVPGRWPVWLSAALLAVAALIAYWNSFHVPFLLDDEVTIAGNPSIRSLRNLGTVLAPPAAIFSSGRPLLNLSFALNYAGGGTAVEGYHAVNLLLHILCGLTLFGLVRRTLLLPSVRLGAGTPATMLAATIALLWTVHPLQTEAVTYISQRAESMMALFYLLTLYGFIRAATGVNPRVWAAVSIGASFLGMAAKEVMVTAPLLVLLYDRAFLSSTFADALRRRQAFYLGFVGAWVLLVFLIVNSHLQGRGVGLGYGVSWWNYLLTEAGAVVRYASLALWPRPLVFDYGAEFFVSSFAAAAPWVLLVIAAMVAAGFAWRQSRPIGFVAAAFFLILAPTSSIVPVALQPVAESRMFLPLAAIITLVVLAGYRVAGRIAFLVFGLAAVVLAAVTVRRNVDYRSAIAIWEDTVAKRPDSSRAQNNLGLALSKVPSRQGDAISHYETALKLKPEFAEAHNNLGMALAALPGRLNEAIAHYETALRLKPDNAQAHTNLANALLTFPSRLPDAIAHYEAALRQHPGSAEFHGNLASALAHDPQRQAGAMREFEAALRIDPDAAAIHYNFATFLAHLPERQVDAIAHYEVALEFIPDDAEIHYNLANLLASSPSRLPEAITHYETALRLRPSLIQARNNLAIALYQAGRLDEAIRLLEDALKLEPTQADAQNNLQILRSLRTR